jgi:alkanesulfonate monooxygenase
MMKAGPAERAAAAPGRLPSGLVERGSQVSFQPVLYATTPPFRGEAPADYVRHIASVARWSEEAGCIGTLVYTDNGLLDPWLCAQIVLQSTKALVPLVAVQPVYMHPYTAAKMIATLSLVHGRRIDLNMVAGGFKNDLVALGDPTPHDRRYQRLIEFTTIVTRLAACEGPVSLDGEFHRVQNLTLTPKIPPELRPRVLASGSSGAGLAAARALGALPVQYPAPASKLGEAGERPDGRFGIRVGIVARDTEDEAWEVAQQRFPVDRAGQLTHQLAMKVSDSSWHHTLSDLAKERATATAKEVVSAERETYWMVPFTNYKTFSPYLVGTYDRVGAELARYFDLGCTTLILDVPTGTEELAHVTRAIARGAELAGRA